MSEVVELCAVRDARNAARHANAMAPLTLAIAAVERSLALAHEAGHDGVVWRLHAALTVLAGEEAMKSAD